MADCMHGDAKGKHYRTSLVDENSLFQLTY